MTSPQYIAALKRLSLTQGQAARLLGVCIRQAHAYAHDAPIPEGYARLLRLIIAGKAALAILDSIHDSNWTESEALIIENLRMVTRGS